MAIKNGWNIEKNADENGKKVAIVGGGPAGIMASSYLARKGFKVCIFEKHNVLRWTFKSWNTRF